MASKTEIKNKKAQVIEKFARKGARDCGCTEVQVALLTRKINDLNEHFKSNKKDFCSNRGLLQMVGQRKRLLSYLKDLDHVRYTQLIQALELRK